jgi:hypothetical protein
MMMSLGKVCILNFSLVHNDGTNNEWKYWVNEGKGANPPDWDLITKGGDILLEPSQQTPLLLKFFSHREATTAAPSGPLMHYSQDKKEIL